MIAFGAILGTWIAVSDSIKEDKRKAKGKPPKEDSYTVAENYLYSTALFAAVAVVIWMISIGANLLGA